MYKKILVPLDGSELGECVFDHLEAITSGYKVAEVILLRVIEPLSAQTISAVAQTEAEAVHDVEQELS